MQKAIKEGKLIRLTKANIACVDCGEKATDYDHRDYSKPLKVDAVCHKCNVRRGKDILGRKYHPWNGIPRRAKEERKI